MKNVHILKLYIFYKYFIKRSIEWNENKILINNDILNNNMNLGKTPLLKVNYNNIKLHKYSDAAKYKPEDDYSLFFNNYQFKLINIHFHKQSEHMLNGKQYDMEAHFVHKAIDANEYVDAKMAAMAAHATQIELDGPFFALSNQLGLQVWGHEFYSLVKGVAHEPFNSDGRETDLFAGIVL